MFIRSVALILGKPEIYVYTSLFKAVTTGYFFNNILNKSSLINDKNEIGRRSGHVPILHFLSFDRDGPQTFAI